MLLLAAERSSGDKNILSMELKMYGNGSQLLNIYFIKLSGSTLHVSFSSEQMQVCTLGALSLSKLQLLGIRLI